MRKDKPYIEKKRHCISCGLFLAALCLCLLSCDNEETAFSDTGESCKATLCLNVSSFGQQGTDGATRSVAGTPDEDLVKDLWVFQFSVQSDSLLKEPVYISESQWSGNIDEVEIDFVQNGPGQSSKVCIVANTHDDKWATDEYDQIRKGFDTYTEFQKQTLPDTASKPFRSSNMGATGGYTIPMYGESAETVIASKAYIRVPLVRMFARVHVYVDPSYPHEMDMSINKITYSNVPLYSRVKAIEDSGEYPADIWSELETENASDYIFYIPENIQGVVDGMTDKMEAWRKQSDLFPEKALAIHVVMDHEVDSKTHQHEYTVYPGGDMKNDFNIKRNHIYNVIIKITSDPSTDPSIPILPEP